jgi:hypothetical protein
VNTITKRGNGGVGLDIFQLPADIKAVPILVPKVEVYYPSLINLINGRAQQLINQEVIKMVQKLIKKQNFEPRRTEMNGSFEVKTNQRGIVSISLNNYAYTEHYAHGMTYIYSLTANINNGKIYQLKDLFKPDSDYIAVLSNIIKEELKRRDVPLLDGFENIKPDQDFYIADKCVVIYFQVYEITPYYVGLPMFPISVYTLENIVKEDGPLGRMIPY